MTSQIPFIWDGNIKKKEGYKLVAVVIDNIAVETWPFSTHFLELFDKYNFVENGLEECEEQSNVNGTKWDKVYNIKVVDDASNIIEEIKLPERYGAMFLSNPTIWDMDERTAGLNPGMPFTDYDNWG